MDNVTRQLEESKHIDNAIIEIDKHILQILIASMTVAVTLLSAIGGLAIGKEGVNVSIIHAYAALTPNLLIIPSFYLMLSQRIDMMRLGAYRRVFFEEQYKFDGWETRLGRLRIIEIKESNDPVPLIFWAIFFSSMSLFDYVILKCGAASFHLMVPLVPSLFIIYPHYQWRRVVTIDLPRYVELWREVAKGN
ncbi:MAG: hypothetical protein HZB23_03670 [Deltaproteobacteria bacterium]|nr:hypothetical protein [Deltaproteobacteria bacterium]